MFLNDYLFIQPFLIIFMKTDLVKGFNDYTGDESEKRALIKKILVDTFERYGFNPVETPLVEFEEFVKGDNANDEAVSDIFKLRDKGDRKLALRYEFTFQLKRLMQNKKLPFKRYQVGPVFRDEPVSSNRFRQFIQCDVDVVGSTIKDEAEILALTSEVLNILAIDFTIYFNNRKLLNEILSSYKINKKDFSEIIREIDKLDKLPEKEIKSNLKKLGAEEVLEVFKKPISYFEKYESFKEVKQLMDYLKTYGIDKNVKFQPSLARGLSYYNGSVFEVKTKKMKETITAGGSYEFNNTQCTGISLGLDRLSSLAKIKQIKNKILIVSLNEDEQAIKIANKLRKLNNIVSIFYGKPSKALDYANSYKFNQTIFVGAKEVKQKKFKVKDMKTGKEKTLTMEKLTKKNVIIQSPQ
jgi:histidyl-tRNA synthetase